MEGDINFIWFGFSDNHMKWKESYLLFGITDIYIFVVGGLYDFEVKKIDSICIEMLDFVALQQYKVVVLHCSVNFL